MHVIHNIIGLPKVAEHTISSEGILESRFDIEPLPDGYGITLWNTLRRVILSGVPGTRVTGVKIKGVQHEYSAIPGVKETVLDMLLNLKGLILNKKDTGETWLTLSTNKAWVVTAKNIKAPGDIEILNPEMHIATIDQNGFELDMEIRIEKNVGYSSAEEIKKRSEDADVNLLHIDANFSPVVNVSYDITDARYGDMTNLDKVSLSIKTNGVMTPRECLQFGAQMLSSYFNIFGENGLIVEADFISDMDSLVNESLQEEAEVARKSQTPVELMGLSPRTLNALVNGNIKTKEELLGCTEAKLSSIKWFGKKALDEVRHVLSATDEKLLWDD